jgi:hypothetical protein
MGWCNSAGDGVCAARTARLVRDVPTAGAIPWFSAVEWLFLILFDTLTKNQFGEWGWRIPFLVGGILVVVGLYIRLNLVETPAFTLLATSGERVRFPLGAIVRAHWPYLALGSLAMAVYYALFYTTTVFALTYSTRSAHVPEDQALGLLCLAILLMAAVAPASARMADRYGCPGVVLAGSLTAAASGFVLAPLLGSGTVLGIGTFMCLELVIMGMIVTPWAHCYQPCFQPKSVTLERPPHTASGASLVRRSLPTPRRSSCRRGAIGSRTLHHGRVAMIRAAASLKLCRGKHRHVSGSRNKI